jgi:hypothetical protein
MGRPCGWAGAGAAEGGQGSSVETAAEELEAAGTATGVILRAFFLAGVYSTLCSCVQDMS